MSLRETIDAQQMGDPDETAGAVFNALNVPAKWADLFYGVVRDECRRRSRSFIRDLEAGQTPPENQIMPAGSGSRVTLLESSFYNGTQYVKWGEATVDDHQGRIDHQTVMRGGIDADIARHGAAIDSIKSTPGATCLNDVAANTKAAA